jgi:hypothetical protein
MATIKVCDICESKNNVRMYYKDVGTEYDGHRNEPYQVSFFFG